MTTTIFITIVITITITSQTVIYPQNCLIAPTAHHHHNNQHSHHSLFTKGRRCDNVLCAWKVLHHRTIGGDDN